MKRDVLISHHGSVVTFWPATARACRWIANNVVVEEWQWIGNRFAVDHRFAEPLREGLVGAGFTVEVC